MDKKPYFDGPFAPMCELFVTQKRAAGLLYETQAMVLKKFDNFCKDYVIQNYAITEGLALDWCKIRPNESENNRHARVGEMQRFSRFLSKQGYQSYILPDLPKKVNSHTPYIFTKEEVKCIFAGLDSLEMTNISQFRHLSLPILFRILYGCGLRISEALKLLKRDVDINTGILYIRRGKNDRERIVPMSVSLTEACNSYILSAHSNTTDDTPFIYRKGFEAYTKSTIRKAFLGVLWDVGIPYRGKNFGSRVHDFRHTFICHNIQQWVEQGIPIQHMLPILSKYVGHTSVSATQWYLRLTPEIYPHLREICERELGGMYATIPNFSIGEDCDE